jgi:hypothetical protein
MMGLSFDVAKIAAGFFLAGLSGIVHADEAAVDLEFPTDASFYTHDYRSLKSGTLNPPSYLLASNMDDAAGKQIEMIPAAESKPPRLTGRKIHQYLGLSTVALAGLTMLAAPEQEEGASPAQPRQTSGTTHTRLARATAAMAVATVMTGLVFHWNDIHWEDPFTDPDKLHARLAAAGALMMLYAVNKSAKSTVPTSHAGIAELGAATMLFAIKLTW